jgi:hypothetical protein
VTARTWGTCGQTQQPLHGLVDIVGPAAKERLLRGSSEEMFGVPHPAD